MSDRRIYPDELAHFGILGMKWGKRNGPPYPIADKDHSASEKKAGWRQSLRNKIRDRDDEYRYRQATKRRKQLDGSVPGGMQIRKLGRSQYYIEPVDPSQRRKIYKNGTIVPDYKKASKLVQGRSFTKEYALKHPIKVLASKKSTAEDKKTATVGLVASAALTAGAAYATPKLISKGSERVYNFMQKAAKASNNVADDGPVIVDKFGNVVTDPEILRKLGMI